MNGTTIDSCHEHDGASAMNITVMWDTSVNNAPAGFQNDVNAVVAYFENQYTDNISFNLHVGYGEVNGTALNSGNLGQSNFFGHSYTYSQVINAVSSHGTTADDTTAIGVEACTGDLRRPVCAGARSADAVTAE